MGLGDLVQTGGAGPVALLGAATLLGVLHALEPGHSKTLTAAFIVAVRGTVGQAVTLGLTLALSHTLIVWLVAWIGLTWGEALIGPAAEPWFVLMAGVIIMTVGLWSAMRGWSDARREAGHAHHDDHGHDHGHHHGHDHGHAQGSGPAVALATSPAGLSGSLERAHGHGHTHRHAHGTLHTDHPHDHHDHPHPRPHHGHSHSHSGLDSVLADAEGGDAHQRAHAADIRRRFSNGQVSTRQVVLFGLASGLIPCSAAVSVLLASLQQRDVLLGVGLVAAFTIGLAAMLVGVGVLAASGTTRADKVSWLQPVMRWAPCASGVVLALVGLVMIDQALAYLGL